MARRAIEVRPIAGALGAEIGGVDLREIDDDTVAAIRKAWLEHCVVFFRNQPLPPAYFLCFAKRFGEIVEYPFIKGIEGFPEIIPVTDGLPTSNALTAHPAGHDRPGSRKGPE